MRPSLFWERVTVLTVTLLPLVGFVITVFELLARPPRPLELVLFFFLFFLGEIGFEGGMHRCFTHSAFQPSRVLKIFLAVLGSMSVKGTIADFATIHKRHHSRSDQEDDPHSPLIGNSNFSTRFGSFYHSYYGWMLARPLGITDAAVKARLLEDPVIHFFSRKSAYFTCVILGVLLPGVLFFSIYGSLQDFFRGVLLGGFSRIFFQQQSAFIINSVSHLWGRKEFKTSDTSTNSLVIALLTLGIGWHNNHHAFPWTVSNSFKWWQVDLIGAWIRFAERLGLAKNCRFPTKDELAAKKLTRL